MESLYARYCAERGGKEVLETEYGFATYVFLKDHCYIEDIYVVPEKRKSCVASQIANEITKIALGKGYTKLLGSVKPSANASTDSVKVLLAYGFKVLSSENDAIFFEKQI